MKNLIALGMVICLSGCELIEPTECLSDEDCKGVRICEDGSCVNPDDGNGSPSATVGYGTPSNSAGGYSDCGQTLDQCGCYPGYYPGYIGETTYCQSGYAMVVSCGQYCWDYSEMVGSVCYCE